MLSKTQKNSKLILILTLSFFSFQISAQDLNSAIKLTESEQFDDAAKAYDQLVKANPTNGDNYYYYGDNYLSSYFSDTNYVSEIEVTRDAEKLFLKGIEVDPSNPLCYVGLGKIALMLDSDAQAEKYFNDAKATFPGKTNKTSTLTPEKQALAMALMADAYVLVQGKKQVTKALELLAKAIELDGKNPKIYLIYGDAYLEANDGSNAISQYKMAQELNPKSPSAKLRLGMLWIRAKNYSEAIGYYKEAVEIDTGFAPAYLQLGILYSKANQLENAKEYFNKYLDLSSTNVSAKIKYASVLIEAGDFKDALALLLEVVKVEQSRNDLNRALAYCYFETGEYTKALEYIEKFFSLTTEEKIKASDYEYHGKILQKNGQDSLAIIKFRKAYELDSAKHDMLTEIAMAYTKLKNYEKAIEHYLEKINKGKAGLSDYYRLGLAYYNIREWEKADTTFAYITNTSPDYMKGKAYYWRGLVNSVIDSAGITWQAKPFFETFINMVKEDSVKYAKDLVVCYDYLASYYFISLKDYCNAILNWRKIIALDPMNVKATELLKETEDKCPELKQ